jgi:hypothetical protein
MRPLASVVFAVAAIGCSTDDTGGFHASLTSGTIALVHGTVDTLQLDVALDGDNVVGSPIVFDVPDLETNVNAEVKIADLRLTLGDRRRHGPAPTPRSVRPQPRLRRMRELSARGQRLQRDLRGHRFGRGDVRLAAAAQDLEHGARPSRLGLDRRQRGAEQG